MVFEWLYLATLLTCFVLAMGNRPQGSNKFYMTMVYFWCGIMIYLVFASIFITVRSIQIETADQKFSISDLFKNQLFFTLIVSLASTYFLWFLISFLFFDPWHLFTSVSPLFSPRSIHRSLLYPPLYGVVPAIPPPHTDIYQHPQRVRLLQYARHHMGHQRRRQTSRTRSSQAQTRRKSRRQHPSRRRRSERAVRGRDEKDRAKSAEGSKSHQGIGKAGGLLQRLPQRRRPRLDVLQFFTGGHRAQHRGARSREPEIKRDPTIDDLYGCGAVECGWLVHVSVLRRGLVFGGSICKLPSLFILFLFPFSTSP